MAEWKERQDVRTMSGAILSIICMGIIVGFGTYFLYLWWTETQTIIENKPTIGQIRNVPFRCSSLGGCNVTYQYSAGGECSELSNARGFNASYHETFIMQVCRASDFEEGTRVSTFFERNPMWLGLNTLWAVELYRNGNYQPVSKVVTNDIPVVLLKSSSKVDDIGVFSDPRTVSSSWSAEPSATILFDSDCFQRTVPFGYICGSVQFILADRFMADVQTMSNTFRANVLGPISALFMAFGAVMFVFACFRFHDWDPCGCRKTCLKDDRSADIPLGGVGARE